MLLLHAVIVPAPLLIHSLIDAAQNPSLHRTGVATLLALQSLSEVKWKGHDKVLKEHDPSKQRVPLGAVHPASFTFSLQSGANDTQFPFAHLMGEVTGQLFEHSAEVALHDRSVHLNGKVRGHAGRYLHSLIVDLQELSAHLKGASDGHLTVAVHPSIAAHVPSTHLTGVETGQLLGSKQFRGDASQAPLEQRNLGETHGTAVRLQSEVLAAHDPSEVHRTGVIAGHPEVDAQSLTLAAQDPSQQMNVLVGSGQAFACTVGHVLVLGMHKPLEQSC